MAKIISSRKKYVPVKDLKVYPSNKETIEVIPDDGFNGAHRYRAQMCAGSIMDTSCPCIRNFNNCSNNYSNWGCYSSI